MKIAVCAIIRNESLYIREWVEYYHSLGFNHIFLYDNNPKGIDQTVTIKEYILSEYVTVIPNINPNEKLDPHEFNWFQGNTYNDCINRYGNDYDWIAFFDADEYIELKNGGDIHDYIKDEWKYTCDQILLNWRMWGDPNALFYQPYPIMERFTHESPNITSDGQYFCNFYEKVIVNTKTQYRFTFNMHRLAGFSQYRDEVISMAPDGSIVNESFEYQINLGDEQPMVLRHYKFKSLSEYINRCTERLYSGDDKIEYDRIKQGWSGIWGWSDVHEMILKSFIKNC